VVPTAWASANDRPARHARRACHALVAAPRRLAHILCTRVFDEAVAAEKRIHCRPYLKDRFKKSLSMSGEVG
jgi:hypothetical protein